MPGRGIPTPAFVGAMRLLSPCGALRRPLWHLVGQTLTDSPPPGAPQVGEGHLAAFRDPLPAYRGQAILDGCPAGRTHALGRGAAGMHRYPPQPGRWSAAGWCWWPQTAHGHPWHSRHACDSMTPRTHAWLARISRCRRQGRLVAAPFEVLPEDEPEGDGAIKTEDPTPQDGRAQEVGQRAAQTNTETRTELVTSATPAEVQGQQMVSIAREPPVPTSQHRWRRRGGRRQHGQGFAIAVDRTSALRSRGKQARRRNLGIPSMVLILFGIPELMLQRETLPKRSPKRTEGGRKAEEPGQGAWYRTRSESANTLRTGLHK